jgi:hypothetical protein
MRDHLRLRCGSTIGLISLGDVPGAMFSIDMYEVLPFPLRSSICACC